MAAMLRYINETRHAHIITIEDPIEFIHEPQKCMIIQREIGSDTESFSDAMTAAIGQWPKGTWHNSMRIDGYDTPIDLTASLTIGGDTIHVDFAGTSGTSVLMTWVMWSTSRPRAAMLVANLKATGAQEFGDTPEQLDEPKWIDRLNQKLGRFPRLTMLLTRLRAIRMAEKV